jgi:hypothetical protein
MDRNKIFDKYQTQYLKYLKDNNLHVYEHFDYRNIYDMMSKNEPISDDFLTLFKNDLNWGVISSYRYLELTKSQIEKFNDYFCWTIVCSKYIIPESKLDKLLSNCSNYTMGTHTIATLEDVYKCQKYSESLIDKHITKLNINYIFTYQKHLSKDFLKKHKKTLEIYKMSTDQRDFEKNYLFYKIITE